VSTLTIDQNMARRHDTYPLERFQVTKKSSFLQRAFVSSVGLMLLVLVANGKSNENTAETIMHGMDQHVVRIQDHRAIVKCV
jgi:hypothetical protein